MNSTTIRPDRRSRREQEIRGRILEAAIACFLERGFEATTIDEIAERADVARGTVFNHFAEKQELLTAYLAQRRQELVDLLRREARADLSARQQLYDALDLLATFNERNVAESRELIGAWWRSGGTTTRDPHTGVVLAEVIAAGQRNGEFRPQIDPALVGRLILDAYAGLVLRWVSSPVERPFSLRDTLRQIGEVILDGISRPKTKASRATSSTLGAETEYAVRSENYSMPSKPQGLDASGFPPGLSRPALRALAGAGFSRLDQLTRAREADLLRLHGFGPKALRLLRAALAERGKSFAP